jgi:CheY-like chemotaxis protein
MTAKVQPGEIAEFLSLGARDVVAKPFDPMTLSDSLRRIWKRIEDTAP